MRIESITIGRLSFNLFRKEGVTRMVRVRGIHPEDVLSIPMKDAGGSASHVVVDKVLTDLYLAAVDPEKVRSIAERIGLEEPWLGRLEELILWAPRNGSEIVGAMYRMKPAMLPWKIIP